jgi:hypothetical protein
MIIILVLIDCVRKYVIIRLRKYVNNLNWAIYISWFVFDNKKCIGIRNALVQNTKIGMFKKFIIVKSDMSKGGVA